MFDLHSACSATESAASPSAGKGWSISVRACAGHSGSPSLNYIQVPLRAQALAKGKICIVERPFRKVRASAVNASTAGDIAMGFLDTAKLGPGRDSGATHETSCRVDDQGSLQSRVHSFRGSSCVRCDIVVPGIRHRYILFLPGEEGPSIASLLSEIPVVAFDH